MSTQTMTSRERLLIAMRGGIPDTVPVQVGTYEIIPAKMTGLPWWDVFFTEEQLGRDTPFENIRAMIDTARRYGGY